MLRQRALFATLIFCLSGTAGIAQDRQHYNLFSGVSYQADAVHGGNASFAFRLSSPFSFVADFSAHREGEAEGGERHMLFGLVGGQLTLGEHRGMMPFARLITGVLSRSGDVASTRMTVDSGTDFVVGFGGGIDQRWIEPFQVRLIQIDYLAAPRGGRDSEVRLSFGLVLSF